MTEKVKSYRDLLIWQSGISLVKSVYELTSNFPKQEVYGLADQMRRSAVSIPSNIAEGQARQSTGDFKRYLYIALGSAAELDTQVVIAEELGYISQQVADNTGIKITEIRKMTHTLISKLPPTRQ